MSQLWPDKKYTPQTLPWANPGFKAQMNQPTFDDELFLMKNVIVNAI